MDVVERTYVSSGCNRTTHSADWGRNGLICFATCHSVAVYRPETYSDKPGGVLFTLNHHKDRVNCVKWMKKIAINGDQAEEVEIVSGSVDNTAVVWSYKDKQYTPVATLKGHTGPVNALDAVSIPTGPQDSMRTTYIATASSDSSLIIWRKFPNEDFVQLQTFNYGTGFALDVSLLVLPNTDAILLACGCDDHKVHVYANEDDKFVKVMTLHGHEDWVRAVEYTIDDNGDVLLASAGQDYLIRIWRFSKRKAGVDDVVKSVKELSIDEEIKMKENTFTFSHKDEHITFAVSLESVLSGHDNWIYSVKWQPPTVTDQKLHQPMCILSASMDKTMILWKPDLDSGVWIEQVRVGEVGGNTLGLYGGMFSPDGKSILAHGYQGAFHHWVYAEETSTWNPVVTASGHFDAVQDLDWDKDDGQFVISVSTDQTTRLHAPWVRENKTTAWYEIARPQVHGYDLQCLALIHRYKIATGADEKVIRTFEAPTNFIENFCLLCGKDLNKEMEKEEAQHRPEGASVPALGLSNKAIFAGGTQDATEDRELQAHPNDQYPEVYFTPVELKAPPSEEHLLQNTLWPETQKLYGHGYEIFALACDPSGKILASSCKAAKTEYASIILWDTASWCQLGTLTGHALTVTQIAFSHSGQYLLTVSRDRTWFLYRKKQDDQPESDPLFCPIAHTDKKTSAHSRIIWSCAWSHDDKHFFTASRDKKVMIWRRPDLDSDKSESVMLPRPVDAVEMEDSVTAVDVARHTLSNERHLVAMGLDNGKIFIYTWTPSGADNSRWKQIVELDHRYSHHLTVRRLRFRQQLGVAGEKEAKQRDIQQLASCSRDHGVRVFNIDRTKL